MSPFSHLHLFILMPVPFFERRFFSFLKILGVLIMGATIVLTKMLIILLVPVPLLCLCRSVKTMVKTVKKMVDRMIKTMCYFMHRKRTNLARKTKAIWRCPQLLCAN